MAAAANTAAAAANTAAAAANTAASRCRTHPQESHLRATTCAVSFSSGNIFCWSYPHLLIWFHQGVPAADWSSDSGAGVGGIGGVAAAARVRQ